MKFLQFFVLIMSLSSHTTLAQVSAEPSPTPAPAPAPAPTPSQQIECDLNCQHFKGLVTTEQVLGEFSKSQNSNQDTACPAGGQTLLPALGKTQGLITATQSSLSKLITGADPKLQEALMDRSHCGTCEQKNTVTQISSSGPLKTIFKNECSNRSQTTIDRMFDSESEMQPFVEQTLKGQTPEGQALYQACPNPCTFHVTTAKTPLNNGKTQMSLTVQCGHPRAGFIMTAMYDFQVSALQQWTCTKPTTTP